MIDDQYHILTELPDSVPYLCPHCGRNKPSPWRQEVNEELQAGFVNVLNALYTCKSAGHLIWPHRRVRQFPTAKKNFIAKRVISILVNLIYLRFKLLKYKENNKNICDTFDHNFKNIPLYLMSFVSFERHYFVLYDGVLTLKMSKWRLTRFAMKLFNKAQLHVLPTRITIPRTTPHQDHYQPVKPLIRTNTCMVGNCPGWELSWLGVVWIRR